MEIKTEIQVLHTLSKAMEQLSEEKKQLLLAYSQGVAAVTELQVEKRTSDIYSPEAQKQEEVRA